MYSLTSRSLRIQVLKLCFGCLVLVSLDALQTAAQTTVYYSEDTEILSNPERGLSKYTVTDAHYASTSGYTNLNVATLTSWRTGADKVTVIYRHYLLDAFMDSDISPTYLSNLELDLNILREAGVKCMVRFAYSDLLSSAPQQPVLSRILQHIQQLKPILHTHKDVILTVQAGFIGTWGEWYYTNSEEFGTEGAISSTQWANRKVVLDSLLGATPPEIPIQVRYPSIKQNLYGNTPLTPTTAYQNTPQARIGFYNDAFLNNWGDHGTYSVNTMNQNPVGTADYVYVANETLYTPMTGETNGLNGKRTKGSNAVFEMDSTNWSVINRDYHPTVWKRWINQGYYSTILQKLGYRFVMESSTVTVGGGMITLNLQLQNKGYARPFRARPVYLLLEEISSNITHTLSVNTDIRTWAKTVTINQSWPVATIPSGTYRCYLHMPDPDLGLALRPEYAMRFANVGTWQSAKGYNDLLQTISLSGGRHGPVKEMHADAQNHCDQLVRITYDPARRHILLTGKEFVHFVEVIDIAGVRRLILGPVALPYTLGVSQWPRGKYLIKVHCTAESLARPFSVLIY